MVFRDRQVVKVSQRQVIFGCEVVLAQAILTDDK